MLAIIIILGLLLFILPVMAYKSGTENGRVIARYEIKPKELEYKCAHVWGRWEEFDMNIVSRENGKRLYKHSAQKRYCDVCGYKQIEKVSL